MQEPSSSDVPVLPFLSIKLNNEIIIIIIIFIIIIIIIISQGAPIHNMHSEQTLALTDHQIRRARNATIVFVDSKVKSKRNRTLQWLEEKDKHSQETLISFAIGRARYARQQQKATVMII